MCTAAWKQAFGLTRYSIVVYMSQVLMQRQKMMFVTTPAAASHHSNVNIVIGHNKQSRNAELLLFSVLVTPTRRP